METTEVLSAEAIQVAANRIAIDLNAREPAFARQVNDVRDEFTRARALGHGRLPVRIVEVIAHECDVRAMLVWSILSRVMSTQPIEVGPQLASQFKALVRQWFEEHSAVLETAYGVATRSGKGVPLTALDELKAKALARVESEIDIELMAAQRRQQSTGQPIVAIYQPFGSIIQTGMGSTASLAITQDAGARAALDKALAAVQDALVHAHELASAEQAQVSELVAEVRTELQKAEPNGLRVRSALSGIGMTIQTLGSMTSAYNLLKGAAILFGTVIP